MSAASQVAAEQKTRAREYSLTEDEIKRAHEIKSEIVFAKATLSEFDAMVEEARKTLAMYEKQAAEHREAIKVASAKSMGWAEAIAMARGDGDPRGFVLDTQSLTRIVRANNGGQS